MIGKEWLVLIICVVCVWGWYLFRSRRKEIKEEGPITVLVDEDKVDEFRKTLVSKGISEIQINVVPVDKRIAQDVRKLVEEHVTLQAVKLLIDSVPGVGLKEAKEYVDQLRVELNL